MNNRLRPPSFRRSFVPIALVSVAGLCAPSASGASAFGVAQPSVAVRLPPGSPTVPPAPTPTSAGPASAATLSITGNGSVQVAPDIAALSIGVRSTAATATGARSKANARTSAVLGAITRLGVDRGSIQTSGISLSRGQVPASRHHPAHKLYSASNELAIRTTKISLVGPVVDAAAQAGADTIDGPEFSFGDPSAGQAAATRAALADARSRADDAAGAIGYRVVGVQSVAINPQESPTPGPLAAAAPGSADLKSPTPTPVNPGRQEVDATVGVVFLIAPAV